MSRIVRLAGRAIDLSGLQSIWLGTKYPIGSRITLFYPNNPTQTIDYEHGEWEQAKKDKKFLQDARKEFLSPRNHDKSGKPLFTDRASREFLD